MYSCCSFVVSLFWCFLESLFLLVVSCQVFTQAWSVDDTLCQLCCQESAGLRSDMILPVPSAPIPQWTF